MTLDITPKCLIIATTANDPDDIELGAVNKNTVTIRIAATSAREGQAAAVRSAFIWCGLHISANARGQKRAASQRDAALTRALTWYSYQNTPGPG